MTTPTEAAVGVEALTDPRFTLPAVEPGEPGTVAWLRATVARFSQPDVHPQRRAVVTAMLDRIDPEALRRNAFAATGAATGAAADGVDPADLAEIARRVPVRVLAEALGVIDGLDAVVADVLTLAPVYLPPATPDAEADRAVARLAGALAGASDVETANRIGLLAQTCAATAALIGGAAQRLPLDPAARTADLLARTLHEAPPARATRRTALEAARVGEVDVPAGTTVRVELTGAPFGAGPHACPGHAHALAMAAGVLDAVRGIMGR